MSGFDLSLWAQNKGWTLAGVTAPEINPKDADYFYRWLETKKGPQMNYLARRAAERTNPRDYFPDVQSILCFGLNYFPGWAQQEAKISNYSWGPDYHDTLKAKLEQTANELMNALGPFRYKAASDTSPALEKILASQAGLGWQGKNTLLLNTKAGSLFFLGELFTDIPLERFQASLKERDHCGTCTRCIDACPTNALSPYELDASQCISYWTLEHKGPFTSETPHWNEWVAGCDICQEVCPWNQKLIPLNSSSEPKNVAALIDDDRIEELVADRAISYVPRSSWKRNLEHIRKIR